MTFTYPGFNSKKGRVTRTPDYWAAVCYGRSGVGATPLEALANATENAVRWYCVDWADPDQMILAAIETGHA